MDHRLVEALMKSIAPIICEHLEQSLAPLIARIEAIEARGDSHGEKGETGPQGDKGEQGTIGPQGEPGPEGQRGSEGAVGPQGDAGERGREGTGIEAAAIDREGELMLTLTNGQVLKPGRVDGRDGLSIEDLFVEHDGERTFKFVFARGAIRKEFSLQWPGMLYRGVFESGREYARGDTVTLNGSMYHCNTASAARPGDGSSDWTLAVKHGRDGRNGRDSEKSERKTIRLADA